MRTTGHRNSKTHAHTGTVRICVVMTTHGRDVHALPSLGPNVRRRRTGCVNRYRLQRCGPRSMGKIGQGGVVYRQPRNRVTPFFWRYTTPPYWTENKEHTTDWTRQRLGVGRVEQSAGVNPLTRRSIQYTFF